MRRSLFGANFPAFETAGALGLGVRDSKSKNAYNTVQEWRDKSKKKKKNALELEAL